MLFDLFIFDQLAKELEDYFEDLVDGELNLHLLCLYFHLSIESLLDDGLDDGDHS